MRASGYLFSGQYASPDAGGRYGQGWAAERFLGMSTSSLSKDQLHTLSGEHLAEGELRADTDVHGLFVAEGVYPDPDANTLFEIRRRDGTVLPVFEVVKDPDRKIHQYHVRLKPEGL